MTSVDSASSTLCQDGLPIALKSTGRQARWAMAFLLSAGLGACAGTTGSATLDEAARRPLRDLNMVHDPIPNILSHAASAPYAAPAETGCPGIEVELTALEAVLGVDVDAQYAASETLLLDMIRGTLQGAIDLPYRSLLRQISGAGRRERTHERAILAGMVRRGFLKGLARGLDCPDR